MRLLDDSLFKLWRDEKITVEDAMTTANAPEELAKRIALAKRGLFDDEDDVNRESEDMG